MNSKPAGIEHLSHFINPSTSGIIWLTDEKLTSTLGGMYELNYLLNGLLTKTINAKNTQSLSNFFLGENFGNPFFIGHTVISEQNDLKKIDDHIMLASPLFNEKMDIFIFNRSKNTAKINIEKKLKSKYQDINFNLLNI